MKTTLKYFAIMATLAMFSTITQQANAQKTATASMTVRANVVESVSLQAFNELKFTEMTSTANGYEVMSEQSAGFSIQGTADLEVKLSFKAPERLVAEEGSSVYFKPVVKVGQKQLENLDVIDGQFKLEQMNKFGQGKTSVWIEGMLQSETEIAQVKYNGDYVVSIDYN